MKGADQGRGVLVTRSLAETAGLGIGGTFRDGRWGLKGEGCELVKGCIGNWKFSSDSRFGNRRYI